MPTKIFAGDPEWLPQIAMKLLDGERDWLTQITSDLPNDLLKLVCADWLQENGDESRAHFMRAYVEAASTMKAEDFPEANGFDEEWLDLIGYRISMSAAQHNLPDARELLLRLARPSLRYRLFGPPQPFGVGASKLGGDPDLPPGFDWPTGDTCRATYNDSTAGETRLAGFVAQINLAEIAHTQAARDLPVQGLLSFFCFEDLENDNPDKVGVRCLYFPEVETVVRTQPPAPLSAGNEQMDELRLVFDETLDLPETYDGPWSADYGFPKDQSENVEEEFANEYRQSTSPNMLGYGRASSGRDPTPDKEHRHLIFLKSKGTAGLHIQIHQDDLKAANFDAIKLVWVDFD